MSDTTTAPHAGRAPSALHRELQRRLDDLARAHRVPGAQLALDTGSESVVVHTGTADADTGEPMSANTAVPLGSLTKPYTAALVVLLAVEDDLGLDDAARAHLPELAAAPRLTVRQLLSHTGGLPTGPDSDTAARTTAARYLASVCDPGQALFPAGTDFSYSNAGYVAAGRVAEAVTGMPWHEAVRTLVLEPLATAPAFLGGDAARPTASGHARNTASGAVRPVRQNLAPLEAPAGGLLASAADLAALGRALLGRTSGLPGGVGQLMRRPEPAARPGALADGWGPGLALFRSQGREWWGHDGNALGTSCHLRVEAGSGAVAAFTGNAASATALWRELAGVLADVTGLRVPAAADPGRVGEPVAPAECLGRYANGGTDYLVARDRHGGLTLSLDGDTPIPLLCYPDLSCDLVDAATGRREPGGRFHRDPADGRVDRVQISGRTARRVRPV